jgi:hypothetical protein
MTPEQRALIKAFIENTDMASAVKVVLTGATKLGSIDMSLDNARFGEEVKTSMKARQMVETAYAQLHQIAASTDVVQSKQNEAR